MIKFSILMEKMRRYFMNKGIKSFFQFIAIGIFLIVVIEILYSSKSFKQYNAGGKTWEHRGGSPENTTEGILKAYVVERKNGIEIDIHFDLKTSQFFVVHDPPKDGEIYPTLNEFLDVLSSYQIKFWLDLKNLNSDNLNGVKNRLKYLEKKYPNFKDYLVESVNYWPLRDLSFEGFNTIYWINPHSKSRLSYLRNLMNKLRLINADFVGVSVYHDNLMHSIARSDLLKKVPLFVFTIKEKERFNQVSRMENVQVILTKGFGLHE